MRDVIEFDGVAELALLMYSVVVKFMKYYIDV
jgi:hypothetical protein